MGVLDARAVRYVGMDAYNAYADDIAHCLVELDLRSNNLIEIVNAYYQDLTKWEEAPSYALEQGLRKVCLASMNRAREARGDPLLD
jgi:hypothetical protein